MDSFTICKQHETAFKEGRISLADLEREMAYVELEFIHELRFKAEPTPPDEIIKYRQASKDDKQKADEKGFWRDAMNYAWLEASRKIWGLSRGNLSRIFSIKKHIPKEDAAANQKIDQELKYYRDFIFHENERARMLGSELEPEGPEPPRHEDLSSAALDTMDQFGDQPDGWGA